MVISVDKLKLQNESIYGRKAKDAYESFIKDFVGGKLEDLKNEFLNCSVTDVERIMEIKRLSLALEALESNVLSVIATGKMAETQLENENVNN